MYKMTALNCMIELGEVLKVNSIQEISPLFLNPKLNNLNFHPLEVMSRHRDLQVGENYRYLFFSY